MLIGQGAKSISVSISIAACIILRLIIDEEQPNSLSSHN